MNETGELQYEKFTLWYRIKQAIWCRYWIIRYGSWRRDK